MSNDSSGSERVGWFVPDGLHTVGEAEDIVGILRDAGYEIDFEEQAKMASGRQQAFVIYQTEAGEDGE